MRYRPRMLLAVVGTTLAVTAADAAVYRCADGDGPVRFSQFPCGNGSRVDLEPLHTVSIPPLTQAQQALLDELDEQRQAAREQRARARSRAAREARADAKERQRRCEAARAAQEALLDKRRHGYSLGEASALDRRQSELAMEVKQSC